MKKTILLTLLAATIVTVFTACCTKRYGRLQNVTELEGQYLSCEVLKVEIEKAEEFLSHIEKDNDEFDKEYVLGILGDFGIGNHLEYKEAKLSAENRLKDLKRVEKEKSCY